VEICPECGERGRFNGWGLSVVELMAQYQRIHNLRAIGPHRTMEDELFHGRMKACKQCGGVGVIGLNNDEDHIICPGCDFRGYLFDGSEEEFESIRQKIIAVYPTAEPGTLLPKPAEDPQTNGGFMGGGFFRPMPTDRSLQAYKDWMNGIMGTLKPASDIKPITESEWKKDWKKYWSTKS
jgi:hypothetical protein